MRDRVLGIIVALIAVAQCETIHFTNSPSHLMGSTNITSYKLLVNNSDPITIIEANKEIEDRPFNRFHENFYQPNDRIDVNIDDDGGYPIGGDHKMKLVASLGASHQVESKNTQNIREAIGITITGGPNSNEMISSSSSLKNGDYGDSDLNGYVSVKKLVYSPVLLKKFIKEYTEKLKNADVGTKNAIQQIHEKIYEQQSSSESPVNQDRIEMEKTADEMEQKYNYNSGYHDNYDDDRPKPADRYKDRDGWVTLEAVPWSSSSVSKWYPNGGGGGGGGSGIEEDTRRRPSAHSGRPSYHSNKPNRFPYHEDSEDDYYNRPKPTYIDRDSRPSVYSTWTKPQSLSSNGNGNGNSHSNGNGRPRPQPYVFTESGSFNSHKHFDRNRVPSSSRPWHGDGDIITDNRPSEFPSESHATNYHDDDHYNTASSNTHSSFQERPSEGNGQWVLISTTKGYQIPGGNRRQHGKRALSMPSNPSVTINAPVQTVRMHKAIKLTVLPANDENSNSQNSTFSTDKRPGITTTTIHNGMVEIDASHSSIDDDVRATLAIRKKNPKPNPSPSPNPNHSHTYKIPTIISKNHRKLLKGNSKLEERIE